MNLRATFLLLGCRAGLLGYCPAVYAQQPAPTADVLLLTSGQEVRGRVLTITPTELSYLPVPATAPTDTLRLATASVFLVRYANGTREVLAPAPPSADSIADPTPPALRALSTPQRRALGQQDALRSYRATGPFWGSLGSTLYLGPLLGLAPVIGISSHSVRDYNLNAPATPLLRDADYAQGYRQQANRIKRRRTWGGYGLASVITLALIGVLVGTY